MHRSSARTFRSLLLALAAMLALVLVVPASQAASVTVRLDAADGAKDSDASVPILVQAAPGIGAMHVELTYDPDVLEATTVDKGKLLDDGTLLDFNIPEPGRVVLGFVTLGSVEGDGEIAVVKFKVIGEADAESALNFENTQAWEGGENRFDILVNTEGSTFTVKSSSAIPWLYIIIGLIVLLLLLLIVWGRRRKPAAVAVAPAPAGGAAAVPASPLEPPTVVSTPPVPVVAPAAPPAAAPAPVVPAEPVPPEPAATSDVSFCSNCGTRLAPGVRFCSKCGTPVSSGTP